MHTTSKRGALVILFLTAVAGAAAAQTTIHVATCGNDAWSGSSEVCQAPDGPKRTIQAAIDAAADGDEVLVAPGAYVDNGNRDLSFRGKAITVRGSGGPGACTIDSWGNMYSYREHRAFVFDSGEGPDSVLTGFTIKGGEIDPSGGAILILHASPTITDCVFRDNWAGSLTCQSSYGGAVAVQGGAPTFTRCVFESNFAAPEPCLGFGGAFGGGVSIVSGAASFTDCQFIDNVAWGNDYDGAVGCGLYARQSTVEVRGCIFSGNRSGDTGEGSDGGGIAAISSTLLIENSVLSGNEVFADGDDGIQGRGGAILAGGSTLSMVNVLLIGNSSERGGGAIMAMDGQAGLTGCSIVGNASFTGGGLEAAGSVSVANSILRDNFPAQIAGPVNATYSDVEGGYAGVGNIDADPLFLDPANGDYRLGPGSPCIDAGNNAAVPLGTNLDLAGDPRFRDDPAAPDTGAGIIRIVDMGCHEVQPRPYCPGDANDDGVADTRDVIAFLNAWNAGEATADSNADGVIDSRDILDFLNGWTAGC